MVSYSFLRPKTASALPTTHNDSTSTIYSNSTTQLPTTHKHNSHQSQLTRRSTQEFARSSLAPFAQASETITTTAKHIPLELYWQDTRKRELESELLSRDAKSHSSIQKGVDFFPAMVRKALQNTREMRTTINPQEMYNTSTSPSSNTRFKERLRKQEDVVMTRPLAMSRFRNSLRRRRNAVSGRSGSGKTHTTHSSLPISPSTSDSRDYSTMPLPPALPFYHPGSAARASAAEHNNRSQPHLYRSDTKMHRRKTRDSSNEDATMVDELTGKVQAGQDEVVRIGTCRALPISSQIKD